MALQFSDTTNKDGIIQHIETELGFNDGDISGNTTLLAKITSYVNRGVDDVTNIMNMVGGTANPDDNNHTNYPIVEANLVAGQQDYSFEEDASGNDILDLVKVQILTNGVYKTITPINRQEPGPDGDFYDNGATGTPTTYDVMANSIFLWPTPSANVTDGIRLHINRTGSYFATSDTIKEPGFYATFHYYLVLYAAEIHARLNQLNEHQNLLAAKMLMRNDLRDHYARRSRDFKSGLRPNVENNR